MKIIGHATHGYICEVSKDEMNRATGISEPWGHDSHAHGTGQIVNLLPIADHVRDMARTKEKRAQAAELLRSCANIIETVPDAFTAPSADPAEAAEANPQ